MMLPEILVDYNNVVENGMISARWVKSFEPKFGRVMLTYDVEGNSCQASIMEVKPGAVAGLFVYLLLDMSTWVSES